MKEEESSTMQVERTNTNDQPMEKQLTLHPSRDVATQLVDGVVAGNITPEEERKCLRRIDLILLPVMFISFAFQYMDKACLTGAALFGIITDLHLASSEADGGQYQVNIQNYSYCSLIFFWGYLVGLIPGVILSQRFPIGKYISITVFLWGGVTVCTVAVQSYRGLLAQRFFLGVTEAGIAPAFSLITAMWYRRQEQPLRFAIWYSSTGIGVLIGTLLLYAIGHIHGTLSPWRYQFMIIGCITSIWGAFLWFLIPDNPVKAYFLSKEMRIVAVERMRFEQIGIENKTVKLDHIKETFTDPKTYFYVVMAFASSITNGAVTGFGSIIVQSFGYSSFKTVLLLGGAGATVFTFLIISGAIAVWLRNSRVLLGMFSCLTVMTGSIMIWQSNWQHTKAVPLWGFYLASVFSSTLVMILALMAANTAGHTKKAATSGLVWASYCASNGIAPLTVKTQEETNHYPTAWIIILSMTSLTFILLGLFRIYLLNLNKKRDEARLVDRTEAATTAFMDMTDGENENFRYQA